MKKILFSLLGFLMAGSMAFAGGLVTNTNQSATWARMLVRDASTSIDAVYYNPAGLTKLSDGFHMSISNQSIFQNRTLTNSFAPLNNSEFEGKVNAPFFPNFYAAYKTGKMAFSLGFTPIGGGGSAAYDAGVPMIEMPFSSLVPTFSSYGVSGYSLATNFEGSSVYFGIQGGISYAINDMISIYAGARYVWAKNTYKGAVSDVTLETTSGAVRADAFLTGLADQATAGATQLYGTATAMDPLITGFGGTTTFDQAIAATAGDPATQAQITALRDGLTGLGQTNAGSLSLAQGQGTYNAYADGYTAQAAQLNGSAVLMADQEADVEQTGNGVTPIVGVNLAFMEDKLNIGIKYEFQTNMELTNKTPVGKGFTMGLNPDGSRIEMFPDGAVTNADIPAQLSIGINYKLTDDFSAQVGYHTYFDKKTGWGEVEGLIDNNYWEMGLGLEYNISEQLLISGGFLRAQSGVNKLAYNDDISYSLSSNTFGIGGAYKINDMLTLQFGGYYTAYEKDSQSYTYEFADGVTTLPYNQEYAKTNMAFAIGLDFTFGGK